MSDNETVQELTLEDRLKAIAYQFIALYERWSEDRQVGAKQGADTAKLVTLFTEQVNRFKELEPSVRQQLAGSMQHATSSAAQQIGEVIGKEATRATEQIVHQLADVTHRTQQTLLQYQRDSLMTQWKVIGVAALTTLATCLLLVWLLIPRPTLPLTDSQIKDLRGGQLMALVWPKLSKKEQQRWLELVDQVTYPNQNNPD